MNLLIAMALCATSVALLSYLLIHKGPLLAAWRRYQAQLATHFGDRVYRTCVPRNVRLAEAPSYGLPVLAYDKQSKGALAYLALAGEIIRRNDTADAEALATAS